MKGGVGLITFRVQSSTTISVVSRGPFICSMKLYGLHLDEHSRVFPVMCSQFIVFTSLHEKRNLFDGESWDFYFLGLSVLMRKNKNFGGNCLVGPPLSFYARKEG